MLLRNSLIVLFIFLIFSLSKAELNKFYIFLDDNGKEVIIEYFLNFENSSYNEIAIPLYTKIYNLNFSTTGKFVNCSEINNYISCKFSLTEEKKSIAIKFVTNKLYKDLNKNLRELSYSLNIPLFTKEFSLTLVLPEKAIISREEGSIFPTNYVLTVDPSGRRIVINWKLYNVDKMDLTFKSVYEGEFKSEITFPIFYFLPFLFSIPLIVFLIIFWKRKTDKRKILISVLNKEERKVIEILEREKMVNQRKIAEILDMSKSKVSRLIKSLEKRGLIIVEKRGRNNFIRISKKLK